MILSDEQSEIQTKALKSVNIGEYTLYIISDGLLEVQPEMILTGAEKYSQRALERMSRKLGISANCLLVRGNGNNILIDTGLGNKPDKKLKEEYRINRISNLIKELAELKISPKDIDYVINTHLHFDHCGWNTNFDENGYLIPTFPNATYVVQENEFSSAYDAALEGWHGYILNDFYPLKEKGVLRLVNGEEQITEGIKVILTSGHTKHHQSVIIESQGEKAVFFGDFIPLPAHLSVDVVSEYDDYPEILKKTKRELLPMLASENYITTFAHLKNARFGRLKEENGEFKFISPANRNRFKED